MKIAICDDCIHHLEQLNSIITNTKSFFDIQTEMFSSPLLLLEKIKSNYYDVIFLDIDMPELNGIELGKQIHILYPQALLIFVTSYPQYAVEGYECEALRYILKPYTPDKIEEALKRADKIISDINKSITVKIQNKILSIATNDIYYVEYCRRHILYHTKNGVLETRGVFSNAYKELAPYGFYQVHQGYIVNMNKIYDFDNYDIILDNKMRVPVSIRKKSEVMVQYAKFLERK